VGGPAALTPAGSSPQHPVANFINQARGYSMLVDHGVIVGEHEGRTRAHAAIEMGLDLDGEVDWRVEGRIVRH